MEISKANTIRRSPDGLSAQKKNYNINKHNIIWYG